MTHEPKICVLLTATIDPNGCRPPVRKDPNVRKRDYVTSLTAWINKTSYPLVFCENSGHDISGIRKIAEGARNKGREVEVLQFEGNDYPREYGKGYGELLIMKYALEHSELIKKTDYIVKVTGRYFVKNIKEIIESVQKSNDLDVMARMWDDLTYSLIFMAKPGFIRDYLLKYQDSINDSKQFFIEHALHRAIKDAAIGGRHFAPFSYLPDIHGYNANNRFVNGVEFGPTEHKAKSGMNVYVIHYKKLKNRKKYLEREFSKYEFNIHYVDERKSWPWKNKDIDKIYKKDITLWNERVAGLYNKEESYRELGIPLRYNALTHLRALRLVADSDREASMVLEDDVILPFGFESKINEIVRQAPSDFDIIFFGDSFSLKSLMEYTLAKSVEVGNNLYKIIPGKSRTADAYIIKRRPARMLVENIDKIALPIDYEMNYFFKKLNFNIYWRDPGIVSQGTLTGVYRSSQR